MDNTINSYKKILDSLDTAVFLIEEKEKKVVYANKKALKLFNCSSTDILNKKRKLCLIDESCELLSSTKESFNCQITTQTGKKISVLHKIKKMKLGKKKYILESFVNIDNIKKKQGEVEKVNEELIRLDKAKSNFLNMVSHELKTPLTAMYSHLGIIEVYTKNLIAQEEKSFAAMKNNARSLKDLIDNILEMARLDAGKFELNLEKFELKKLIEKVILDLKVLSDRRCIKVRTKFEKIPKIYGDEIRVKEVITNLLSNAVKFTEDGTIDIIVKNKGSMVEVTIKDTGIGIPKEKLANLFKKFYQVDSSEGRRFGGTGLGLSIVKQIVEMQGGSVTVKSKLGKGSTFKFTLKTRKK